MSAAESEAAGDRLAAVRKNLGEGDFSTYAFLALGLLGHSEPAVLHLLLDRADNAFNGGVA